ncbi:MAG: hypothetical protein OEZ21_08915 [Candidatus Bathyarchaeota archaeon]|nr:hypothetical protein [Candidatus Bathyarchaeota archaeon]MDH5747057.1 hypothetical protein [Candidatus Bathyarchaeota archaeon]
MSSMASNVISAPLLETLRIIAIVILLMMVIEFLELKHGYEIRRKITVKLHEKRNKDRWRNLR